MIADIFWNAVAVIVILGMGLGFAFAVQHDYMGMWQ